MRRLPRKLLGAALLSCAAVLGWFYSQYGAYGFNVVLRRGGSYWVALPPDSPRLSDAMRLALRDPLPEIEPGSFDWQQAAEGFEIAELPVLASGQEVERLLLARVDPTRFRFEVRNAPAGNKEPADWMKELGAALVITGSYYGTDGHPDTPVVSAGERLGPTAYEARHGAFVSSDAATSVRDLAGQDWRSSLVEARDAMVSYPLLLAADGTSRVTADRRWLANRTFVAEDSSGRIILGTTRDAFFSLDRLAAFLRVAPLQLKIALNLDGGPIACQFIAVGSARRSFCGQWETSMRDGQLHLLTWGYGSWALPVVLAVVPR